MEGIVCVRAPNPGPFTLEGTNTWVVGTGPTLVIDPGPDDPGHIDAVGRAASPIEAILLTHHHADHRAGAALLAARAGAPVHAAAPRQGENSLLPGHAFTAGGVRLEVVGAPGHSKDHVVFFDPASGSLFTGDAVLGRGTSVIDPPDGDLRDYLDSLDRMRALGARTIFPGHGPVVPDADGKLREYIEHRRFRERQILAGLERGPRTPDDLVPLIYGDYPGGLHQAAARSVLAHLIKLEADGAVRRDGDRFRRDRSRHERGKASTQTSEDDPEART
ncbi:MAG: MBL fold metallo-hydrolase [Actinobacteria bacterium]|nr:MAG: MBL fold metallo-hydrolase [Actinomycetota bacterium]